MTDLERFVRVSDHIYGDLVQTPKLVLRARAILRVLADEPLETVVSDTGLPKHHLRVWVQALSKDGLYGWLGKPEPKPERIQRAKGSIAQVSVEPIPTIGYSIQTNIRFADSISSSMARFFVNLVNTSRWIQKIASRWRLIRFTAPSDVKIKSSYLMCS